ncbi:MAG TPA: nuclear transport factor 2 family protein, partial [Candidatus Didemnitutus sp.]|nr:nuclear transport factor 2 family protein [Candidatus Didemnitutus sp.]
MKTLLRCLALFVLPFATALAATVESDLRAVEAIRLDAIRTGDFGILSRIYSEDFSAIVGNGLIVNRAEMFELFKRNDPTVIFATDEIVVREYGDTAVFTGRLVAHTKAGQIVSTARFT